MESVRSGVVLQTILGVPLALAVWVIIYALSYAVIYLLDFTRGLEGDWLQRIFREWFTPGFGGYAAMHTVSRYLKGASTKWVAVGFCLPILTFFLGLPLYFISLHSSEYLFSWKEQIMQWGMAISSCVGAYISTQGMKVGG